MNFWATQWLCESVYKIIIKQHSLSAGKCFFFFYINIKMLLIFKTMYEDHKQIFKIEMKLTNVIFYDEGDNYSFSAIFNGEIYCYWNKIYVLVSNLICYDSCANHAKQDIKYFRRPRNFCLLLSRAFLT